MGFLFFLNCMAVAFAPPVLVYRNRLAQYGSAYYGVVVGALTFLALQLSKLLFVATFVPDTVETSVWLDILRALVSGFDVLGISFAFRYARMDTKTRAAALAVGWVIGENIFTRFIPFWVGAWSSLEFDWTYLCMALESNASLVVAWLTIAAVDQWSKRAARKSSRSVSDDSQSFLLVALLLSTALPLALTFASQLGGEWVALAARVAVALVLAPIVRAWSAAD